MRPAISAASSKIGQKKERDVRERERERKERGKREEREREERGKPLYGSVAFLRN